MNKVPMDACKFYFKIKGLGFFLNECVKQRVCFIVAAIIRDILPVVVIPISVFVFIDYIIMMRVTGGFIACKLMVGGMMMSCMRYIKIT